MTGSDYAHQGLKDKTGVVCDSINPTTDAAFSPDYPMTTVSIICFGLCFLVFLTVLRPGTDMLSPGRVFVFIWSFALGLTDLKLSGLQEEWALESWILLILGLAAFACGIFLAYILHARTPLVPIQRMRTTLTTTPINQRRLLLLITLGFIVYAAAYAANYAIRGWLPIQTIGTAISRVSFNVSGLTLFLYVASFVLFFGFVYFILVKGHLWQKVFLAILLLFTIASFSLLLMRYPIMMVAALCFVLLYYSTKHIRPSIVLPIVALVGSFFFWISSLRFSHVVSTYLYSVSKMKVPREYAFVTEPYMYIVTNLENFARSVKLGDYHTYGYFTLDFITALSGLKYWVLEYFNFDRTPYLTSNYNTYTAFYWFYSDFGVLGLAVIPFVLGAGIGMLYYHMRNSPTIENVTAYGVMVFVMFISYFNFPLAFLWFQFNLVVLFLGFRFTKADSMDFACTTAPPYSDDVR